MSDAGRAAEDIAAAYLQQQRLRLLLRNYRCRHGEIDLVMQDGEQIVFVEVRLRSGTHYGGAGASITSAKQRRLLRAAEHYLQRHSSAPCRFDVILLSSPSFNGLQWLKNAFDSSWI